MSSMSKAQTYSAHLTGTLLPALMQLQEQKAHLDQDIAE